MIKSGVGEIGKTQFSREMAEFYNINYNVSREMMDAVFNFLSYKIALGYDVNIMDLGRFEHRLHAGGKTLYKFNTGELYTAKESEHVFFIRAKTPVVKEYEALREEYGSTVVDDRMKEKGRKTTAAREANKKKKAGEMAEEN